MSSKQQVSFRFQRSVSKIVRILQAQYKSIGNSRSAVYNNQSIDPGILSNTKFHPVTSSDEHGRVSIFKQLLSSCYDPTNSTSYNNISWSNLIRTPSPPHAKDQQSNNRYQTGRVSTNELLPDLCNSLPNENLSPASSLDTTISVNENTSSPSSQDTSVTSSQEDLINVSSEFNLTNPICGHNTYKNKLITPIVVAKNFLSSKNVSIRDIHSMEDITNITAISECCSSQQCSIERHSEDMGMICHTVCIPERCKNFNECRNNIQYFKEKNSNRLCIKVNKLNDRGLYVKDLDFEKGEFIAMYNGLVNVYDAPQTSNFVMNISPRYSIDAANPLDSTIPVCLAGFINHGCRSAANAFTRIVNTGSELVVAVHALKLIPKDMEIRFDYAASSPNERSAILSKLGINKCNCSECFVQSSNRVSKRIKNQKQIGISSSEESSTYLVTNINSESNDSSPSMTNTTNVDQQSPDKSGLDSEWIQISHTQKKREKHNPESLKLDHFNYYILTQEKVYLHLPVTYRSELLKER